MKPVKTIPEKERRGKIQVWYVVRALVDVTFYPQYNNNKKEKIKLHSNKGLINKKIEMTFCILPDYNGIILEINNKKKYRKTHGNWAIHFWMITWSLKL
jgi:hypothetical protein